MDMPMPPPAAAEEELPVKAEATHEAGSTAVEFPGDPVPEPAEQPPAAASPSLREEEEEVAAEAEAEGSPAAHEEEEVQEVPALADPPAAEVSPEPEPDPDPEPEPKPAIESASAASPRIDAAPEQEQAPERKEDQGNAAMPNLEPLCFAVSMFSTQPVVVSRLLSELLLSEGQVLTAIPPSAEGPTVHLPYVPRKRRKEERCPLCADNPSLVSCGLCGCAQCLRKILGGVYIACPDCRNRYHVDCFPSQECRGCEIARQPAAALPVQPVNITEAEVAAFVSSCSVDADKEVDFRAFCKQANVASLARLHKANSAALAQVIAKLGEAPN